MVSYILYENDLAPDLVFGDELAIDCEMMGLNLERDRLCLLQIFNPADGKVHIIKFSAENYEAPNLKKLLSDPDKKFIGHMIRLDLCWIYKYLGVLIENLYCTRTASRIAQTYGASHDYVDLVDNLLGVQIDKSETNSYWGRDNLDDRQLRYACEDVVHLPELKKQLNLILKHEDRSDFARYAMENIPNRVRLDVAGWQGEDLLSFPF